MAFKMRVIFKDKKNSSGTIRDGEIVLYISTRLPADEQQRHIEALTKKLLKAQARARRRPRAPSLQPSCIRDQEALIALALEINGRYFGYSFNKVSFRTQRSRWGSCNGRTRNINISHRLKGAPLELLEYVIIHELCHLKEMNHGLEFWVLVSKACPDYRRRRQMLKDWDRWLEAGGFEEDAG